ncbi:hypothetical protein V8G54_002055 [Vigna mungo]|uniref:Uncharacterized protein n=1 Tax=Vigna mungo TaxID=3915 RepID=A0AAQ3P9F8_VIGMU
MSDSGAILQFKAPKTVAQVLQHYPGYGIFRQGHASEPLPEQERLSYGLFYYLLPLKEGQKSCCVNVGVEEGVGGFRMKLVIEQRQLEEILSEQVNTEALIEKMRMAATGCSTTSPSRSPTMSTWKVGWKTTLFSGKFAKDTANVTAGSNLYLGSC